MTAASGRPTNQPAPRVMHVVVAGDIGGAEKLLLDITSRPEQTRASHAVALMTPNPKLRALIRDTGVRLYDRGHSPLHPLAYLWRTFGPRDVTWLAQTLRDEQADLVHVHTYASHILGVRAARLCGLPVLRTEHGLHHYTDPTCGLFRRKALHQTDMVVCVSDYVRRFVAQWDSTAATKLRVARNGVNERHFTPAPFPPDQPFTFSIACRLEPWKQVDRVVEAMAHLPDCHLVIAGDGSQRATLEARAKRLGIAERVRFLGYCPDPRSVLAMGHVSINSSREEPLGLSVLEALASGRPVIAFAGGGVPEIVQHRVTGWLVPPQSQSGLVAAMREASQSPALARVLGAQARTFVERSCRIDTMCHTYGLAYADLLQAHRRTRSHPSC